MATGFLGGHPGASSCGNALVSGSFCFLLMMASAGHAQTHEVVCKEGNGSFAARFHTGVGARVEPAKNGEFAARACQATVDWEKQGLQVVDQASLVDLDAFGIDLGVGVPVATFQVKKSEAECCVTYQILSLEKPPHLVRTLTGGDFFSAADTDLDGRVEIWTDDAAAVDGLEDLSLNELDFAPTVVLRFTRGQLVDVGAEFQSYYDHQIADLHSKLDPQEVHDFKNSDGKLANAAGLSLERLHRLRAVKVKVLEIVWCYLYSGREPEAWRSLAEMWPSADVNRIQTAIREARGHGIDSRVDGVAKSGGTRRRKHAQVFDAVFRSGASRTEVVPPQPILLWRPPSVGVAEPVLPDTERLLDLIIDSAGKVRSAEPAGKVKWADAGLISATAGWKFIPAYEADRAVASHVRLAVSLLQ